MVAKGMVDLPYITETISPNRDTVSTYIDLYLFIHPSSTRTPNVSPSLPAVVSGLLDKARNAAGQRTCKSQQVRSSRLGTFLLPETRRGSMLLVSPFWEGRVLRSFLLLF